MNTNKLKENIKNDLRKIKPSKVNLISTIPFFIMFYIGNQVSRLFRISGNNFLKNLNFLFYKKMISFNITDLLVGIFAGFLFKLLLDQKLKKKKEYRDKEEYGSARWGKPGEIDPYMNPIFEKNIILSQTEGMNMENPKSPKYARNKNVLIVGGSGSGKTRFFLKPNLMQLHSSYVITDPKGSVLTETGLLLRKNKYKVKTLNLINFNKSMKYNPFRYIKTEKDILKLVNVIIENTKGEGDKGEDFWVKAERLLLTSLIALIHFEGTEEEKNINTLLELIDSSEVKEDEEDFKNPVDFVFEEIAEGYVDETTGEIIPGNPNSFAVRQYTKYKLAAGKTAKSILISVGARLAPFDIEEVRNLMSDDELELDRIGDRKTALFVIIPDTDATFNFIAGMMYSQMFNTLCEKADDVYGGKLPIHVRCLLDEFANIGKIPNFEKLIATIRSREISACPILQSKAQLKALYKDSADTIIGNCDSEVFLGGKEKTTLKDISEMLGKETIDLRNTSENRGNTPSSGVNHSRTGKSLGTVDELAILSGDECLVMIRGVRPFKSKKFNIEKHKQYKHLSDYDKKNVFDIEKYLYFQRNKPIKQFDISEEELKKTIFIN